MSNTKRNPFKELEESIREVPPEMRQKVMDDVATAKLMMDITFLVTNNYPSTLSQFLKTKNKNKYN
ncbi:hypothetical protein ACEZ3G_14665 [Maribacter algicola]|uniref:Uncharacterized protein n=1 Tax=Meishania litoralis TaxID=3434685 RepID=A0ACC7LM99_9FLAO